MFHTRHKHAHASTSGVEMPKSLSRGSVPLDGGIFYPSLLSHGIPVPARRPADDQNTSRSGKGKGLPQLPVGQVLIRPDRHRKILR